MSDLNFSDTQETEPMAQSEDAVNENTDLDEADLDLAEVEAEHELDGFQIEEVPSEAEVVAADVAAAEDDPYRKFRQDFASSLASGLLSTPTQATSVA